MKLSRLLPVSIMLIALLAIIVSPQRVLAQRPIGIDVSDYQSASIDWNAIKNTYGVTFAWAKASEGNGTTGGSHFPTYVANAKAAGVIIGAYHYARYDLHAGTN